MAEAFRSLRGIYGVSESALSHFEAIYGEFFPRRAIVRTIHNFVDTDRFVPSEDRRMAVRRELGIPEDALVVGSIGRIDEQKEPQVVARVFARCLDVFPQAWLVFAGQGPLRPALEREIASLGIGGRTLFTGFRSDTERLYPALDVHLLLSRQEGFGITTAEAMACRVPVVATDVPGTCDVLAGTDAGLLVRYGAEEAAAIALQRLLGSSELRSAMGRAGRSAALARFSKSRWESEIARFYHDVLT